MKVSLRITGYISFVTCLSFPIHFAIFLMLYMLPVCFITFENINFTVTIKMHECFVSVI